MNRPVTVDKYAFEASLCKQSLYDFVRRFWTTIIAEKPIWNWHIEYLCEELQRVAERVFNWQPKEYDLIINISPGSTKSTICSVMFPAWCWTRQPFYRTLCGSYAQSLSLYLADQCKTVVTSEKYKALFPDVHLAAEAVTLMKTTRGGVRISTSPDGSGTGMHAHTLLIDDPLNPREAASEVMLAHANKWLDRTVYTRCVDKRITAMVLIMQRLDLYDCTGHLLGKASEKSVYRHVNLPAMLSEDVRPRNVRAFYKDGLFDPVRLPQDVLDKALSELGQYAFAGQYLQRPIPPEGGMFRVDQIQIVNVIPKIIRQVRYWDKAGTAGGGAWTVGVKMGLGVDKNIYVLDVKRGQWEAYQRERTIRQTAETDGKHVLIGIEEEGGSGGKESAQDSVRNLSGYRVKRDRPKGPKDRRADVFATQVNGGVVKCLASTWVRQYLDELATFPQSRYKDQVDASSGCYTMVKGVEHNIGAL